VSLTFDPGQPGLEPYALQQRWSLPRPPAPAAWAALFSDYLAALARLCTEAGTDESRAGHSRAGANRAAVRVVIGHIKLLALFGEGEYLRVSVVSPRHAATVTGAAPAGLSEMPITVNVLVYGLPTERLAALTAAAAAEVAERWGATVEDVPLPHHHHHHEGTQHADQP
jgi:hypothetical protein